MKLIYDEFGPCAPESDETKPRVRVKARRDAARDYGGLHICCHHYPYHRWDCLVQRELARVMEKQNA